MDILLRLALTLFIISTASVVRAADRDRQVIEGRGSGPIYYYEPTGPGRLAMRPVLMYLHGRGGNPAADCEKWARVARALGWLVCPSGPAGETGGRSWNNNWPAAKSATMAAVAALREKFGRRVQLYGNTIVGFSEGAYVAMNIGIREPRSFNRLLILAANTKYWGAAGREELKQARSRIKRVYLITGERDEVIEETRTVRSWLREAGVRTRITTPADMGHELAIPKKPELYRMALLWLQSGQSR
jgi:predicted esterase